jgi:hypothetical protein
MTIFPCKATRHQSSLAQPPPERASCAHSRPTLTLQTNPIREKASAPGRAAGHRDISCAMAAVRCGRATLPLLLLLLLLTLMLVSHCVDAAASKKGAASSKKSSSKDSDKKPAPSKKDWNKMTEDEWNAAEQEALDPEDRYRRRRPAAQL